MENADKKRESEVTSQPKMTVADKESDTFEQESGQGNKNKVIDEKGYDSDDLELLLQQAAAEYEAKGMNEAQFSKGTRLCLHGIMLLMQ